MHEILDHLPAGSRVLDLGARDGTFPLSHYPHLKVVRLDMSRRTSSSGNFVQADAAQLPFLSHVFDAVILNHCLEHFVSLKPALQEVGRVAARDAAVFVAVPDARTVTDRIYRKIFAGRGGHVNLFGSSSELTEMLSWYFGLPHVATRELSSSLSFLNRRNLLDRGEKTRFWFPGLWEPPLHILMTAFRLLDRRMHTRLSMYGWALYFGQVPEAVDPQPRGNVCIRCGQAHSSKWLEALGLVRRKWMFFLGYECPGCKTSNVFLRDKETD